jgi:hypothetical protein
MSKRHGNPNGPVPAHAQVPRIVEEDRGGGACRIARLQQVCANHNVGAARLAQNGAAKSIVFAPQNAQPLAQRTAAKAGKRIENAARRFACRM